MILFSRFMADFIDLINQDISPESKKYRDLADFALKQFNVWCWDDTYGFYTDRIIYEDNPPIPTTSTQDTLS